MESSFCIAAMSGIPTRMTPSGTHLERKQIYYHGVIQSVIHQNSLTRDLFGIHYISTRDTEINNVYYFKQATL